MDNEIMMDEIQTDEDVQVEAYPRSVEDEIVEIKGTISTLDDDIKELKSNAVTEQKIAHLNYTAEDLSRAIELMLGKQY